jgi:PAS domain S-box-containing protein
LVGVVALVLVGALSYLSTRRLQNEGDWVAHTYEVLGHLDRIEIQTRVLEHGSDPATVTELATIRDLTADNAVEQARLDTLTRLIDGPPGPILTIIGEMQAQERQLLGERIAKAANVERLNTVIIVFSTILATTLMGVALALLHRDLEARRRTEMALQDSETKHRLLMEQAADAIIIVDSDAVCVDANARATDIIGRPKAEFMGMPLSGFLRGDDPKRPAGLPMLRYGQVTTGEFWIVRPDDSRVPVEVRATLLDDGRVQIIARDISERKEVDRLKGEFVSMVSHELRTPLTSIRGALGLLASGRLEESVEKRQRMIDLAAANTDRLIRLINNILDVERINSNAPTFEQARCDVRDLVEQVVETITPLADKAGIAVHWSAPSIAVWADADRMAQTLTNLVDNAVKFSPAGSNVIVEVTADDTFATFSVRDEGRGIPADKLESVFDRFQQVDASDSRDKGGSGLGLAISRGIVQQHGGRMWVESVLGEGTTFRFTIPLAVVRNTPAPGVSTAPLVLVCDDDVDLLVVLRATLEQRGYRVMTASLGKDAMQRFDGTPANAVIVDTHLPDVSGLQIIRHVRATSPSTKTILYTGAYLEPDERDFARATGTSVMTKAAANPGQVADEIDRLLQQTLLTQSATA